MERRRKLNRAEEDEEIEATQAAMSTILQKMELADKAFCDEVRQAGANYFVEFAREYFSGYMRQVPTPFGDIICEPSPETKGADRYGPARKRIPDAVSVGGVDFTKVEVQTCIRLSNIHLE